ncbi:DNA recombination-mediator protein A [anaerobic digester metagenome]
MNIPNENSLRYPIALTLIPGIGDINARKLLSLSGSAEAIFKETRKALSSVSGMSRQVIEPLLHPQSYLERAQAEIEFIHKHQIKTSFITDDEYPNRLKQCTDSPVMIYWLGNGDLNAKKIISIVGTRKATDYGKTFCQNLIADLKEPGLVIVSGLAYGIDTYAHKAALDNELSTFGILAHGLDRIYPPLNQMLADKMLAQGGLVTEFLNGSKPDRENFPRRNRIIAGLADATVVIEAGKKGGALITADIANSYNRDVFAVPGRIGDPLSEGCNQLIKTNRAALIQSAADIRYIMNWDNAKPKTIQRKLFVQLKPEEEALINLLQKHGDCSMDKLCNDTSLQAGKVAEALLNLEFEGLVRCLPGKIYRLL